MQKAVGHKLMMDTALTSYKLSQFLTSFEREHRPDISDACVNNVKKIKAANKAIPWLQRFEADWTAGGC
jgi:hypothetical protein